MCTYISLVLTSAEVVSGLSNQTRCVKLDASLLMMSQIQQVEYNFYST